MMKFVDDPQTLLAELDSSWEKFGTEFDELMQQALASVVSYRWATQDMFPSHPLFGQADTTPVGEPWRPFTRKWLRDDDPKANLDTNFDGAWQHGVDDQGRIVLARNKFWGFVTFWRDDFCDRLRIFESKEEEGRFIWGLPGQDRVEFTRFWHKSDNRIDCLCCYLHESGTHYRQFEWFRYEANSCVESIQQQFEIMAEIPYFQREETEEKLRKDYRPLDGGELIENLVETMFLRRKVQYSYGPSGDLIKVEEFYGNGKAKDDLRFHKTPDRPFEETIDQLAAKTAAAILKAAKKRSKAKPYRALALIYSAEHAHCGLPHQVCLLGHEEPWPKQRFLDEQFSEPLEVAFTRPVLKLLNEFNQRCHAQFGIDDDEAETAAAVTVMRTIAQQLHHGLAGTKHVTDDFAVLVLDDHGDVDGFAIPE